MKWTNAPGSFAWGDSVQLSGPLVEVTSCVECGLARWLRIEMFLFVVLIMMTHLIRLLMIC